MRSVVVLGGGPVGLTLANYLSKKIDVLILVPTSPVSFSTSPDSEFTLSPNSNSGVLFGNSVNWGSQHEPIDIQTISPQEFSDLPGFPFDISELAKYEEELICQGWPKINPMSRSRGTSFTQFRETRVWKGKSFKTLPKKINQRVEIVKSDFQNLEVSVNQDSKISSIKLDGVVYEAKNYVLALGGLSNVAFLDSLKEKLPPVDRAKLSMLGVGCTNHPKTVAFRIHFKRCLFDRNKKLLCKYTSFSNFDLISTVKNGRPPRISARFWPTTNSSNAIYRIISKIMGIMGGVSTADVAVYFELPQLSKNRIQLSSIKSTGYVFKYNYQFPINFLTSVSNSIETLRQEFAQSSRVRWVENFSFDFVEELKKDTNHHFGGTRMAESNKFGVVDSNGRTFCSKNLFVVGTSTLPVSSSLHPTLLCAGLALRTADEILQS